MDLITGKVLWRHGKCECTRNGWESEEYETWNWLKVRQCLGSFASPKRIRVNHEVDNQGGS